MYPAVIDSYDAPTSVQEALQAFARRGNDLPTLSRGRSEFDAGDKAQVISPKSLIDCKRGGAGLGIEYKQGAVRIGAITRYRDIAADECLDGAFQALRDAASHVGDRQVRNRGTIGGSLCWNYIAACMPPTCIGIGASLDLVSKTGKRSLLAEEFCQGPLETARRDNEFVVAVTLPAPRQSCGSAYKKWGLVTDALPVAGVCAFIERGDDGRCELARLAVGGSQAPVRGERKLERRL